MLRGLPASIIIHGAVIFGGTVAWPYIAPERKVEELIPVTMDIQLDVVTNFAPVVRREVVPDVPEPEPEEEIIDEEVLEDEPDAEEVETGEDELETTDVRELEQEQAAEEESVEAADDVDEKEDEPEEAEEKKAEGRNREPDALDDLLSDSSKLFSEVKQQGKQNVIKQDKKILVDESQVRESRKGVGDKSKETARIEALIYSQMIECWDGVLDQPNYERLQVTVKFKLTKDGKLDGNVERLNPKNISPGDRPMRLASDRALRAARKCAPYRIPKDAQVSHEEWKDVILDIGH